MRNEIVRVITSINRTTEEISNAIKKLTLYQNEINYSLKDLKEARASASTAKDYYLEYLTLLHKIDLELYDPQGQEINEIRLLLNSDNISKTLYTENIINAMTLQLEETIEKASIEQTKKIALLTKLGELKQQAKDILDQYYEEIEKLEQKKQYLVNFLEIYKSKQSELEQQFQKIFSSRKDVHESILSFLDEIVQKNYKSYKKINEKIQLIHNKKDSSDKENAPIAWPIYPIEEITRYFGDKEFEEYYKFKFQGLQVKTVQGTPIHAVRDGVVYHVFDNTNSISWVMIVHTDGYVSVYEFLNSILVEP